MSRISTLHHHHSAALFRTESLHRTPFWHPLLREEGACDQSMSFGVAVAQSVQSASSRAAMSEMERSTRSRAGEATCYGMPDLVIEEALQVARNERRKREVAMAGLAHLEKLEAQEKARVEAVRAQRIKSSGCECMKRQPGGTMENALALSDDDDDLEILEHTFGQVPIGPFQTIASRLSALERG